uniref:CCHC-type domain-containing protein n=1 Tax=Setaria italica TaxID=4555 RepID=K3Y2Q5_SETIT
DEQGKQNKRRMDERGERNLGGDDLHHRLARDQDRDPAKQQRGGFQRGEREGVVICFRCNQEGHHRSECSNPLLCYNSKASGHMSQSCPRVKVNRGLKLCGFGLLGQLFYSIHGTGSVTKVTTELRYLINSKWDWQVRKIANGRYEFVVPTKADLEFLTKFTEFQCKSSDLKVSVEKASISDGFFDLLTSVWVKMSGMLDWARKEKPIEEAAYLIGDPEEVDRRSLQRRGPVRVKVACKNPKEINETSNVYFNGLGFQITWTVEMETIAESQPPKPADKEEEDDENDEIKSDDYSPFMH